MRGLQREANIASDHAVKQGNGNKALTAALLARRVNVKYAETEGASVHRVVLKSGGFRTADVPIATRLGLPEEPV